MLVSFFEEYLMVIKISIVLEFLELPGRCK
jgi:hypothetical protein